MGMQRDIQFAAGEPTWEAVVTDLRGLGEQPILRMIDGLPAFPDEVPDDGWRELRVSVTGGMVTIRRAKAGWSCVVWGNADDSLRKGWEACCAAVARAGNGVVDPPLPADGSAPSERR